MTVRLNNIISSIILKLIINNLKFESKTTQRIEENYCDKFMRLIFI